MPDQIDKDDKKPEKSYLEHLMLLRVKAPKESTRLLAQASLETRHEK